MTPRPSKSARIRHMMGMMARGTWVTGVSGDALACQWQLSPASVERDAAEASRRVRDAVRDSEELRALALATLTGALADLEDLRTRFAQAKPVIAVRALEAKIRGIAVMLGETGRRGKPQDPIEALPPIPPAELVALLARDVLKGATDDELAKHGLARIAGSRVPSSSAGADATGTGESK
ncbi:MAG: hypothetical protein JW940_12665 [Polyangiaceae bacterium]|nr:hypothetical protein [Polyangiaceae bacterium]